MFVTSFTPTPFEVPPVTVWVTPANFTTGFVVHVEFEHSPVPVMFRFVGTPDAEYVVYTAVITGAGSAAALSKERPKIAATAATRTFIMCIPCCLFGGFSLSCAGILRGDIPQVGYST